MMAYEKWKSSRKKDLVYQPKETKSPSGTLVEKSKDLLKKWENCVTETNDDAQRENQKLAFNQNSCKIFAWTSGDLEDVINLTDPEIFKKKGLASRYSHDKIQELVEKMEKNSDMVRLLAFLEKNGMIYQEDQVSTQPPQNHQSRRKCQSMDAEEFEYGNDQHEHMQQQQVDGQQHHQMLADFWSKTLES